ncbi:hypothetical protein [Saccharicrinis fermentans]|uniref:Lipoprotein n=1 Tax=Saccharicrinis fermentans DSM 9555 = JCM 21142 TaxID=869213 RepID=W7XVZ9_9BACT|nr:hypothetical protein [Saccharicrinis fermentans]GAF02435.1 hypothetical protein JCM21142_31070 [Saccharicrinis fermentans DSM 9555 = JCM 21142]
MKNIVIISMLVLSMLACSSEKGKRGPDYAVVKKELGLNAEQEKQFDNITEAYQKKREETFAAARSAGNMNREAVMAQMKQIFADQGEEIHKILNKEQFEKYADFMENNIPGKAGYTKKILAQIKSELQLTEEQYEIVLAVDQAFEKSYVNAHDKYHGDHKAAKAYWMQFDKNRKDAIKNILNEEQYNQYLKIVQEVSFRGEHGKQ